MHCSACPGADDGYSIFAAIGAIQILQRQGVAHSRMVILVEACEESGSRDLMHWIGQRKEVLGTPSLVVCLDSGCHNYKQSEQRADMQRTRA